MNNNSEMTSKAQKSMVLRLVVAVYIAYLGVKIFKAEETTMNITLAHIIGAFFVGAAAIFCVYSVIRMKKETSAAGQNEEKALKEQHDTNGEQK